MTSSVYDNFSAEYEFVNIADSDEDSYDLIEDCENIDNCEKNKPEMVLNSVDECEKEGMLRETLNQLKSKEKQIEELDNKNKTSMSMNEFPKQK